MLRMVEEKMLYKRLDEETIDKERLGRGLKRAGKILLISDLEKDGGEVFMMYKQCGGVENQLDTYKNVLNADRMYLQDDESVFGHIFTSSLALYGYGTLETALKEARLLRKFSPIYLLEEFSKVYIVTDGEQEIISEIPRKGNWRTLCRKEKVLYRVAMAYTKPEKKKGERARNLWSIMPCLHWAPRLKHWLNRHSLAEVEC